MLMSTVLPRLAKDLFIYLFILLKSADDLAVDILDVGHHFRIGGLDKIDAKAGGEFYHCSVLRQMGSLMQLLRDSLPLPSHLTFRIA